MAASPVQPGMRFGALTVLSRLRSTLRGHEWLCQCACGRITTRCSTLLRRLQQARCGRCAYANIITITPTLDEDSLREFVSFVQAGPTVDSCWAWGGKAFPPDGRGKFSNNGSDCSASRFAWEAFCGPVPAGLVVLHLCDNPGCVNPDHMSVGTQAANMFDKRRKGRAVGGGARLDPSAVRDIVLRVGNGESPKALAAKYSVSATAIRRAAQGATWRRMA